MSKKMKKAKLEILLHSHDIFYSKPMFRCINPNIEFEGFIDSEDAHNSIVKSYKESYNKNGKLEGDFYCDDFVTFYDCVKRDLRKDNVGVNFDAIWIERLFSELDKGGDRELIRIEGNKLLAQKQFIVSFNTDVWGTSLRVVNTMTNQYFSMDGQAIHIFYETVQKAIQHRYGGDDYKLEFTDKEIENYFNAIRKFTFTLQDKANNQCLKIQRKQQKIDRVNYKKANVNKIVTDADRHNSQRNGWETFQTTV
jgi:hypothetical protein